MLEQWKSWLTEKLTVPEDVITDTPRLTMIGQHHLLVENHHGIRSFFENRIELHVLDKELIIKGEQFVIKKIHPEELLIAGVIEEITYGQRKEGGADGKT
ncbi:sporulation protein YqfC [Salibacterium halotolerans]|uniref:Sporulation protein YqfC n=1 Tax=Salibacterium halotolerans TaxID=1884432 RepID=A0A1I5NGE0_9BACI|nr:sporulation protein YqfC [Salibacterium halotolerans]SFP20762.1 sporulation protein YqfC [Salibacterium halotolerans]